MRLYVPPKEHYSCNCSFFGTAAFITAFPLILLARDNVVNATMKSDKRPQTFILPESIGKIISTARQAKGWSLRQLAEAAGVGPTTIHRLEGGDTRIQYDIILRICDALALRSSDDDERLPDKSPTHTLELEVIDALRSGDIAAALEKVAAYLREKK